MLLRENVRTKLDFGHFRVFTVPRLSVPLFSTDASCKYALNVLISIYTLPLESLFKGERIFSSYVHLRLTLFFFLLQRHCSYTCVSIFSVDGLISTDFNYVHYSLLTIFM